MILNLKISHTIDCQYLDQAEEKADKAKSNSNNAVVDVDDILSLLTSFVLKINLT